MAITPYNPMQLFDDKLETRFKENSFTEAHCGHDYDVKFGEVDTIITYETEIMPEFEYTNTGVNRFTGGSAPTNVVDYKHSYTLSKNISFSKVIDEYTNADKKHILQASRLLKDWNDETVVPIIDQYRLNTWAKGHGTGTIGLNALDKDTIVPALLNAQAALRNRHAYGSKVTCFLGNSMAVQTKLASQLEYNRDYTNKAIINGEVARMGGMPIIGVPDDYLPSGVDFMIKGVNTTADPRKLKMLRVLKEVQGYYGPIMEGLIRYDSFVMSTKAEGIFLYSHSGVTPTPTFTESSGTVTVTGTTATTGKVVYTLDGTNPKNSSTAIELTLDGSKHATITLTSGKYILRMYEKGAGGALDSAISRAVVTIS